MFQDILFVGKYLGHPFNSSCSQLECYGLYGTESTAGSNDTHIYMRETSQGYG